MNDVLHAKILTALQLTLRPLARLLLRHGITFRQFAGIAKEAFVEEVLSERDPRGRLANKSRIAVRTGLSRKEIARICDRIGTAWATSDSRSGLVHQGDSAARALQIWHLDPKFQDTKGAPRNLTFAGNDSTFSALVKLVGRDIPPGALRAELLAAKAIAELPNGDLMPLRRHFIPAEIGEEFLVGLTHIVVPVMEGLAHNTDKTKQAAFFQRFAYSDRLTLPAIALFRERANERSAQFLQEIDNLLGSKESGADEIDEMDRRVGIGVFYFEGAVPRAVVRPAES